MWIFTDISKVVDGKLQQKPVGWNLLLKSKPAPELGAYMHRLLYVDLFHLTYRVVLTVALISVSLSLRAMLRQYDFSPLFLGIAAGAYMSFVTLLLVDATKTWRAWKND